MIGLKKLTRRLISFFLLLFRGNKRVKLSVKAMIRWEQLNDKPFSSLNYSNENDIISLLYVCGTMNTTLDQYKAAVNKKELLFSISDFEKQISISSQFKQKIKPAKGNTTPKEDNTKQSNEVYVKDIVSVIIMRGLDVNYALNEMDICDLSIFIDAYENITREKLETERLWTYISISPHLSKSIPSPRNLVAFSWEQEDMKLSAEKALEEGKEDFERFMNSGDSLLKK